MYKLRDYSLRRGQRLHPHLGQQVRPGHYAINLPLLMAECSANYVRLSQLTQVMDNTEFRCLIGVGKQDLAVHFVLLDQAKYTSTWSMTVTSSITSTIVKWPQAQIRAYHDAQLVEVLKWSGQKHFLPRYDGDNGRGYAKDEKYQLNILLGEWISLCLRTGRTDGLPFSLTMF